MQGLAQKVCLITGAGSGLGRASALALAGYGSRLAVADINAESAQETVSMIESAGGQGTAIHVDVSDSASVQSMVEAVESAYGGIDILVNNAGVVGELKPLHEVSEESWDFVQSVDMKGVFLCSKFTIPGMLARGKGVIINVASVSGFIASKTGVEYTAAKHGVTGLTKQTAYDYGHQGIRAVGIGPGVIETPLTAEWTCEGGPFHELTTEAPAGRYGLASDVAKLVCFLASDDADFIHGHTIPIDGGSVIR